MLLVQDSIPNLEFTFHLACHSGRFMKMVLFGVSGGKLGRIFSLALLLLVTARVSGQQGTYAAVFSIMMHQYHHRYHRLQYRAPDSLELELNALLIAEGL